MIDLQAEFKAWHTAKYGTILIGGHKWGLQAAIADTYRQFLDKSQTWNVWSRGLYRANDKDYTVKLLSMIEYAVRDCLAVTKLAYTMGEEIGSKKIPFSNVHVYIFRFLASILVR